MRPTADFHLVVCAALKEQPGAVEPDEITGAVGPLPAEGRHRGVLLRVLRRIEVAGEPHSSDDQLADFALGDRRARVVDNSERPSVEGEPDPNRAVAVQQSRARDHGRLGRAVRVPDLPAFRDEAGDQFGRAGLAAEDQQPHVLDGVLGPQRGECRNSRHHGDPVADKPRPEILTGAHQRSRRRNQACTVAPREPHLLAGRIERHREAREHAVTRRER